MSSSLAPAVFWQTRLSRPAGPGAMAAATARFAWARALAAIGQIHATLAAPSAAVMQDRPASPRVASSQGQEAY